MASLAAQPSPSWWGQLRGLRVPSRGQEEPRRGGGGCWGRAGAAARGQRLLVPFSDGCEILEPERFARTVRVLCSGVFDLFRVRVGRLPSSAFHSHGYKTKISVALFSLLGHHRNSSSRPKAGICLRHPQGRPDWGQQDQAARERSRVQTLRHAFLQLQKTLPSVPPDTKLSKLDVLLLATTYIAHLTRSLQDEEESPGEGLGTLRGDGYLHPVKKWPMRSRLYIGATGQFLTHSAQGDSANQGETSTASQI
ncbi:transcription factor 24 [Columba livia]|uniref:Transcription factor 24 n=1 Tax=Columba livia TaxID=8932 RepID=A0A2I0MXR9_COLLI|nr:transcription factor 24 [Columba livia]